MTEAAETHAKYHDGPAFTDADYEEMISRFANGFRGVIRQTLEDTRSEAGVEIFSLHKIITALACAMAAAQCDLVDALTIDEPTSLNDISECFIHSIADALRLYHETPKE